MARANIKTIAATAEIVTSIAVVVSLLFVVYSIDQNTASLRSINDNFLYELQDEKLSDASNNGELASIIVRYHAGEELSQAEQARYGYWTTRHLNMWELAFNRYNEGLLPPNQWIAWDTMFAQTIPGDITKESWFRQRYGYGERFANHVDAIYSGK